MKVYNFGDGVRLVYFADKNEAELAQAKAAQSHVGLNGGPTKVRVQDFKSALDIAEYLNLLEKRIKR